MALILIIDDDVAFLSGLAALLEEAGHQALPSSDITHAERLFAEQRPELVLLEVRSGGGAGWELLGRLAAEAPLIVLSGSGREEDVVRGFTEGAVDYIAKPYRSAELLARIAARLLSTPAPALRQVALNAAPPAEVAARPAPPAPRRRSSRRDDDSDEAVFMSEAEEMALLRSTPPPPPETRAPAAAEGGAQTIGRRLRAERLRRHLTLVQIENELKIRMSYLQALEDDKFTLLPRGPVAPQMLRSYANYLGIDASPLVEEYQSQHYIEPADPLPALGGPRLPRTLPLWVLRTLAILLALLIVAGAIFLFDPVFFNRLPTLIANLWQQLAGGFS